jgi:hypothetical protein
MTTSSAVAQHPQDPHWREAAFHWHAYGPPLRPCAADVRAMEEIVRRSCSGRGGRPPKALLLGVTPEIATMAWPPGTELLAVDRSRPMLEHVWPGDVAGQRTALCADWLDFACGVDRRDVVVGDGIFALLDYPAQYRALAAAARDWIASDGILLVRFFVQPAARETPDAVFDDLLANRIGSFHGFKLRLAMALQRSPDYGVRMGDVFDVWTRARVDLEALLATTGWTRGAVDTIRPWDGKDSRLSFPTAAQIDHVVSEHFDKLDERRVAQELGERCPIMTFRPRRRACRGAHAEAPR